MIVAISAVSESGDHYLFCECGTPEEIIRDISTTYDFAYWSNIDVVSMRGGNQEAVQDLKNEIRKAIDKAYKDQ